MGWKKVLPSYAGSTGVFGGDDINKISDMFSGVANVDTVDINSVWTFRSGMFQIGNPAVTQEYKFVGSAITADRIITIPLLTADGKMVVDSFPNVFLETITLTKNSQSGVGEILLTMSVSDDATGYVRFYNTTTTNAIFSPA